MLMHLQLIIHFILNCGRTNSEVLYMITIADLLLRTVDLINGIVMNLAKTLILA